MMMIEELRMTTVNFPAKEGRYKLESAPSRMSRCTTGPAKTM